MFFSSITQNYRITGANSRLKKIFQKQIIEFCGMKLISFNMFGGVDKSNTKTSDILDKIKLYIKVVFIHLRFYFLF